MPWRNSLQCTAQLGLQDKGCAIKGLGSRAFKPAKRLLSPSPEVWIVYKLYPIQIILIQLKQRYLIKLGTNNVKFTLTTMNC